MVEQDERWVVIHRGNDLPQRDLPQVGDKFGDSFVAAPPKVIPSGDGMPYTNIKFRVTKEPPKAGPKILK